MLDSKNQPGFTIVELLIVIVVIAILAAISMVAYNGIDYRSKSAATGVSMNNLRKAMLSYKVEVGELPPLGDSWNYDTNPPNCNDMTGLLNALALKGYTGISTKDAWGNCWGYDDNDCNTAQNSNTYIKSVGPDGVEGGTDDISLLVTPAAETPYLDVSTNIAVTDSYC